MNGGGPLAAPLRALRYEPVLVDDLAILPRLVSAVQGWAGAEGPLDAAELVRWTRAWVVAWQGWLHEHDVIGTVPPWTVPLPVAELPSLKGDPERRRRAAALALCERAGVVRVAPDRRSATLTEAAFAPHRAGLEIDWAAACRAVRLEPASLLVLRALVELVVPPGQPAPVTLRELSERTGYAAKQVRIALRRLTEAGVVVVTEAAGQATQYRFGAVALPQRARPANEMVPVSGAAFASGPSHTVAAPGSAAPPASAPPASPPIAAPRRQVALRLTLNGVTLSLGVGLAPHVELGPDGVPHVTFDPPSDG